MTLEYFRGPSNLDGNDIVLLAGGVDQPSLNRKTGPVVQMYILRADRQPWTAVRDGSDASICGDCFHRASETKKRTCYVDLRFVTPVFFAARKTGSLLDLYGRDLRFGAYGDPVAVPYEILERLTGVAKSWLGYTEFWRLPFATPYRKILMASVHSEREQRLAQDLGWRTFRDRIEGEPLLDGELECPFMTHETQCIDCKLCNGARQPMDRRKNISLAFHGMSKRYAENARLRVIQGGGAT